MKAIVCLCLLLLPSAGPAQDLSDEFLLRQRTRYFDFRFQRKSELAADLARFADAFIDLLSRDFFKPEFDFPIRVLVLEDKATFQDFLKRRLRVATPPGFGCYFPSMKTFVTYETSGLGTFAHEIIHPFIERNWPHRPVWAGEAIPTFFEKFYGYWKGNELVVHWGFHNPWRIQALGAQIATLDLKAILTNPDEEGYHESEQRLISMFLWKQGKFKELLKLIGQRDKKGFGSYVEAAMGLPIDEIVPLWNAYVKDIEQNKQEHLMLPPSTILEDEASFLRFAARHHLRIAQQENP